MQIARPIYAALVPAFVALGTLSWQSPPRLQGRVVLTIGASDSAPEEYQFDRIRAMAIAPDGRLVVVDRGFKAIRVYDANGRFQYDLFREGAGPGEVKSPGGLGFSGDGSLWIRDEGTSRWSAFKLGPKSATFVRSIPRSTHSMGESVPVTFDRAGLPIDAVTPFTMENLPPVVRLRIDSAGKVIARDTVRPPPQDSVDDAVVTKTERDGSMTRTTVQPIFGSKMLVAHSPFGEYARVVTRGYDIDWRGEDGRRIRRIQRQPPLIPLNRDERDAFESTFSGTGLRRRAPQGKAPIHDIAFDQEGRLWVVRAARQGTPREADVFDRTGKQVAIMILPRFTEIHEATAIRNNTMLVQAFDTTGIRRVNLIQFR